MRTILILAAATLAAAPPAPAPACACATIAPRQSLAGATALGAGTTTIPVQLRSGPGRPARTMVVIEGLRADAPPGVLYKVRLRGRGGRTALLGVISVFSDGDGGGGGGNEGRGRFELDAGAALRTLGGAADAILFEPSSGVSGEAPRTNPAARVRLERISIERR
jgi:hypothetical protein